MEGDEIEDAAGDHWVILEVNRSELNRLWQCVARGDAVRFGLDEYVDHLKTGHAKTPAGTLQQFYQTVKTGIAAKFSPVIKSDKTGNGESCYVIIREQLDAETGDFLRRADGAIFTIRKITNPLYRSGWTEMELVRHI